MQYASKLYKEDRIVTYTLGETQLLLNLVTDEELKEYEVWYKKYIVCSMSLKNIYLLL